MRILLITILVLLSSYQSKEPVLSSWLIDRKSSLSIDGSSNINVFTCEVKEYLRTDTIWGMNDERTGKYAFTSKSKLTLDVRRFDCKHKYITADFRKMLKYELYPTMSIRFLTIEQLKGGATVKGQVLVEIAGKNRIMEILYQCTQLDAGQVSLTGSKTMKFSDFGLDPPKKIGGLIRINEEIDVRFDLYFRKLHS